MEKEVIFDKIGVKLLDGDVVLYTTINRDTKGKIRWNGISNIWEVINDDIQSGGSFDSMTNTTKWL